MDTIVSVPTEQLADPTLAAEGGRYRTRTYRVAFEALQCEVDDGAEAARIVETLERSDRLVLLAHRSGEPLYSTRDMIEIERDTLKIAWRGRGQGPRISAERIEAALQRADAELKTTHGPEAGIKDEQRRAIRHALGGDQYTATQGFAGTGKSFITKVQREIVEADDYQVFGTAPSWKAVDVLRSDSGLRAENCVALAKLLHDYRTGNLTFDARSFIIVDEASMISARDMHELMQIARDTGASVHLQGDKGQFRPIGAGCPFAALQRLLGAADLQDVQRQRVEWQRAASISLDEANNLSTDVDAQAKIRHALQAYDDAGRIVWADDDEAAFAAAVDQVMRWRAEYPEETTAIITEWNCNVRSGNALLRERLRQAGQISGDDVELQVIVRGTSDNSRASSLTFAAGDEVIFGENIALPERTLRNNDLGRVLAICTANGANPLIRFRLEDGEEIEARYAALVGRREDGEIAAPRIQHAYFMTAHSSQGATYARTIDLSLEGHGREATLVTTTRHRIDHMKVVAVDRVADQLASKKPTTLALGGGGVISAAAEVDDERRERGTLTEIKSAYLSECSAHDHFGNISDLHEIFEFAGIEKPALSRPPAVPAVMHPVLVRRRIAVVARGVRMRRSTTKATQQGVIAPMLQVVRGLLAAAKEGEWGTSERMDARRLELASEKQPLAWWEYLKRVHARTAGGICGLAGTINGFQALPGRGRSAAISRGGGAAARGRQAPCRGKR